MVGLLFLSLSLFSSLSLSHSFLSLSLSQELKLRLRRSVYSTVFVSIVFGLLYPTVDGGTRVVLKVGFGLPVTQESRAVMTEPMSMVPILLTLHRPVMLSHSGLVIVEAR